MSEHPENTPVNRFFAALWALGGVFVFGLLGLLIASVGSAGDDGAEEFDAARAAERSAKLKAVREGQAKLLAGNGEAIEGAAGKIRVPIEVAEELVLKEIGKSVPRVTTVPIPGSPAALALMEKEAAAAAAAAPADPGDAKPDAPKGDAKPAAPKKADDGKPAAPKKADDAKPAEPKKAGDSKGKGKGKGKKGKGGAKAPVTN